MSCYSVRTRNHRRLLMREYELTVVLHPDLESNLDAVLTKVRKIVTDNGGKITFSCTSMEGSNALQVILKISLAQTDFPTEQYGALRQFFELFIEKSNTQLVLKKQ